MPKATDDHTTSPDAQLLRACAAFWAAEQRLDHLQATSPRAPFGDPRTVAYEGQIEHVDGLRSAAVRDAAKLPALTPEGLRAKALAARTALLAVSSAACEPDPEEDLAVSVLDDIANAGGLISGSAAIAAAGAGAAGNDAELILVCAEYEALQRQYIALCDGPDRIQDDDECQLAVRPLQHAKNLLLPQIRSLRATTLEGFLARARLLMMRNLEEYEIDPRPDAESPYHNVCLMGVLLRDLAAAAGLPPAESRRA